MLSPLVRFLFPKTCFYCKQLHPGKGLLCEICLVGLDIITPKGRCQTCFRESVWRKCPLCNKSPSPWYRAGSIFSGWTSAEVLLSDPDRFSKEIAAFFIIQYSRLYWPSVDALQIDPTLEAIGCSFRKFLPIPAVKKRVEYAGKKILYLTKHHADGKISKPLQGARVFYLSYIFPD
jgi:hypothetical protein